MTAQPLDVLMNQLKISNKDLVNSSTEQLSFKMVQKGRQGERLSPRIQDKILTALQTYKPDLKLRRRDLFRYDMEEATVEQIKQALELMGKKKIKYPQFIDHLGVAGINRYAVNVAQSQVTFYGPGGEAHIEQGPEVASKASNASLDQKALHAAISDAQQDRIDHTAFLKRIHDAGVVSYEVNIRERIIRYRGVTDTYKEQISLASATPDVIPAAPVKKPASPAPKAAKKKKTNAKIRIKKTGKFIKKHRTKR